MTSTGLDLFFHACLPLSCWAETQALPLWSALSPPHLFSYSNWLFSLFEPFLLFPPGPLEAVQETFAESLCQSSARKLCWRQVMKFLDFEMLKYQVGGEFRVFLKIHSSLMILRCSNLCGAGAYIWPGIWYLAVF